MGELGAFLKIHRVGFDKRDPRRRVDDYDQYFTLQPEPELRRQGARCMDCGVPFCHEGCPLGNLIPDWNDLVYRGKWRDAIEQLHATNNFPEFTGLICPAPCESSCVLKINDDPVTIEQIELAIVERAYSEGWVTANPPIASDRSEGRGDRLGARRAGGGRRAQPVRALGDRLRARRGPGGLLRFGVPDAKLEKWIIDRRVSILQEEGIEFVFNADVGTDITAEELQEGYHAVVLAIGSRIPRGLDVPNHQLAGIHPAMDYLYQRNRWVAASQGRPFRETDAGGEDHRRGQEGDRDRGRRHRHGLHLQLAPRAGRERDHARCLRAAARAARIRGRRGRCHPSAPRRRTRWTRAAGGDGGPR